MKLRIWTGLALSFASIFFFCGCATPQPHRALGRHLKDYRKVYLVKGKGDPQKVTPRISSRLQLAGFDVGEVSVEEAKELTKAANEKNLEQPTLICVFTSVSAEDALLQRWHSFDTIQLNFYDLETSDLVYRVSHFDPDSELPEATELNRLFIQISDKFFPEKPNPFKSKK